jgi:hypothetical protein
VATKGERAKAEQQRAAHAVHPPKASRDSAGKRAAARGRRKDGAPHNEAPRAARKSSYQFEVSATARPSRKSTRRSATTRVKPDAPLRITTMNRIASPKQRASRPSKNPN